MSRLSIVLLVVVVGAVVSLGVTEVGLLVPAWELNDRWLQVLRVAGGLTSLAGAVWLVVQWRSSGGGTTDRQGMIPVTLIGAAVIMGLLALLALPTSEGFELEPSAESANGDDQDETDDSARSSTSGSDPEAGSKPAAGDSDDASTNPDNNDDASAEPGDSPSDAGSNAPTEPGQPPNSETDSETGDRNQAEQVASQYGLEGELAYTVAVDRETGKRSLVVLEHNGSRGVAIDPETGQATPLSIDQAGTDGSSNLALPATTDPVTGEAMILGVQDPGSETLEPVAKTNSAVDTMAEPTDFGDIAATVNESVAAANINTSTTAQPDASTNTSTTVTQPDTTTSTTAHQADKPDSDATLIAGRDALRRIASRAGLDGDLAYTVARDGESGSLVPAVLEFYGTGGVVIDPKTGKATRISTTEPMVGHARKWTLPVTVNSSTDETKVLGLLDPDGGLVHVDDLESAARETAWKIERNESDLAELDRSIRKAITDSAALRATPSDDKKPEWDKIAINALGIALLLGLFGAVLFTVLDLQNKLPWRKRRQSASPPTPAEETPISAADAAEGLQMSLMELAQLDGDPRRLITAAYLTLLAVLAEAGAQRRPHEAPHEHLHRALVPLGIRPEPLHRLADLYLVAQFSEQPVTSQHRQQAVETLQTSLADLRASGHWTEPDQHERVQVAP